MSHRSNVGLASFQYKNQHVDVRGSLRGHLTNVGVLVTCVSSHGFGFTRFVNVFSKLLEIFPQKSAICASFLPQKKPSMWRYRLPCYPCSTTSVHVAVGFLCQVTNQEHVQLKSEAVTNPLKYYTTELLSHVRISVSE